MLVVKQFFDEPVTRGTRVARIIQASRDESEEDNGWGGLKVGRKLKNAKMRGLTKSRAVIVGKSNAGKNKNPLDKNRSSCRLCSIEVRNQFTAG